MVNFLGSLCGIELFIIVVLLFMLWWRGRGEKIKLNHIQDKNDSLLIQLENILKRKGKLKDIKDEINEIKANKSTSVNDILRDRNG